MLNNFLTQLCQRPGIQYQIKVIIRPSEPSWINPNIKCNIRQRRRLYKKAKRVDTSDIWEKFKHKRNKVNALIRTAKTQYNDKLANDLKTNDSSSKKWYKLTSEILTQKTAVRSKFLEVENKIQATLFISKSRGQGYRKPIFCRFRPIYSL